MPDLSPAGVSRPTPTTCAGGCPRHAALSPLLGAAGWLAAATGSLLVAAVPFDIGESVCGLWGCFPPLPPLVAMHLCWLFTCGGLVWAVRTWRPVLLRPVGTVLLVAAVAGTAVVVGRDLPRWLEWVPAEDRHFWPRRVAYTVLTLTDVPLLQSLVAGVVSVSLGRRRTPVCRAEGPGPNG